jgi:hypothetical protein
LIGISQPFDVLEEIMRNIFSWLQNVNDVLQRGLGNNFPSLIPNLGLALLSILIPLAIVVLTDFYQKKGKEDKSLSELDLYVILDTVFQVKRIVLYSILAFLPYAFWDISYGFVRLSEVVLSLIGVAFMVQIILKVYHWTRGNVAIYRVSYLKTVEDPTDLRIAWRSVWRSNELGYSNEMDLFNIFSSKIDETVKQYEKRP